MLPASWDKLKTPEVGAHVIMVVYDLEANRQKEGLNKYHNI